MATIDSVIAYIATLDAGFKAGLRGADEDEIQRLEELTGRPLPADYRLFLQRMGHGMDWLNIQQADFDIKRVIQFYTQPEWELPSNLLFIGWSLLDAPYHVHLAPNAARSSRVVSFPPPFPGEPLDRESILAVAGSLEEMIGTRAFRTLRMHVRPAGRRLVESRGVEVSPDQALAALSAAGLQRLPFSNDWTGAADSAAASAVAAKGINSGLVVDVAADNEAALDAVCGPLEQGLRLRRLPVKGAWREET